jgi:uncharacterized membrane protein
MKVSQYEDFMMRKSLRNAGIFLGLGLGGFFDGIVLHLILQWHHMLTEVYPATNVENLELNILLDGFFHVVTYIFTSIGLFSLWRLKQNSRELPATRVLIGSMLMGWGIFNVVEGIIDHHLLQIHHVRPGENQLLWDLGFLIWGLAMLAGGWYLSRVEDKEAVAEGQSA